MLSLRLRIYQKWKQWDFNQAARVNLWQREIQTVEDLLVLDSPETQVKLIVTGAVVMNEHSSTTRYKKIWFIVDVKMKMMVWHGR